MHINSISTPSARVTAYKSSSYAFFVMIGAIPHIKTGKVVAVALTGPVKVGALPSVSLASETLKGYTVPNGWLAFFAPAGTPQPIIDRLNKEIVAALNDPAVKERLQATGGYIVASSTPSELGKRVQQDTDRWAELIRHANIPPQ
jgi:tripartite-type tricarboxylate transporter receptor subunit TctC